MIIIITILLRARMGKISNAVTKYWLRKDLIVTLNPNSDKLNICYGERKGD